MRIRSRARVLDATTVQTVNKQGGKVMATQTSKVSAEGKTRTPRHASCVSDQRRSNSGSRSL